MFMMFARFNFKSADLAAEDRNYFDNHVRLARQLPGVRMYLTGRLIDTPGLTPDRYRAVVFGYDTAQDGLTSLDNPIGAELMADSAAHIMETTVAACEGEVLVPFDGRSQGLACSVAVVMYNLAAPADPKRLRSHRQSVGNLPGLCGYIAGPACEARGERPARDQMEIRIFRGGGVDRQGRLSAIDAALMEAPLTYCFAGEVQI